MHPAISVSQVSSWGWTLDEDLDFYDEAGIGAVGVALRKLVAAGDPVAAARRIRQTDLRVTNLLVPGPFSLDQPERWPEQRRAADLIMDVALELRPDVVVFTTGPAGKLPWERAADAFAEVMQGMVAEADREGLLLAVEHTHALRRDTSFLHSLRDAIEVGFRVDMATCCELNACWAERNLAGTVGAAVDAIALVQVSDWAVGTHTTPDRLVPGDGDLPLERLIALLLDAGYQGTFDIEIIGPKIEEEGYPSAIRRSIEWLGTTLTDYEERQKEDDEDEDEDEDDDGLPEPGSEPPADFLWPS